jgi:methylated-DNA-[protein]-cysteine S-methyltransferase
MWPRLLRGLERRFGSVTLVRDDQTEAAAAVTRYFAGELTALDRLPVDLGGTPFQRRVWARLREVPAGQTTSYRELAARVGNEKACRAVGAANASNPVSVVVPCHRVVRSDGSLCGYAGGVDRKAWLLEHEGGREAAGIRGWPQRATGSVGGDR